MMTIIVKRDYRQHWRIMCPTCSSIVEGDLDDFDYKVDGMLSTCSFMCPACNLPQTVNTSCCFHEKVKIINYRINEDGSLGEEIKN